MREPQDPRLASVTQAYRQGMVDERERAAPLVSAVVELLATHGLPTRCPVADRDPLKPGQALEHLRQALADYLQAANEDEEP